MRFFRKPGGDPLVVAMAGVKLGERVLVLGTSDATLIAGVGIKSGLSGRTCVVADSPERAGAAVAAAEAAGALVEGFGAPWGQTPFEQASFDVALLRDVLPGLAPGARVDCLREVRRVLRPSGRVMVIDSTTSAGLIGGLRPQPAATAFYDQEGGATRALEDLGFKAVRTLARRDGLIFTEGARPPAPA